MSGGKMSKDIKNYFSASSRKRSSNVSSSSTDTDNPISLPVAEASTSKQQKSSASSIIQQLDKTKPITPSLEFESYQKTRFGQEKFDRHFKAAWYDGRPWLEYITEIDACVCYPCRVYSSNNDSPFVTTGFKDWKHAGTGKICDDNGNVKSHLKGFAKHANSVPHRMAMKTWEEHKARSSSNLSINTMVLQKIPEHRTWVETVFNVVKFLAMNGLPFRGDVEKTDFASEDFGGGLYLNTFADLVFPLDDSVKQIAMKLPGNAKYTSSDIQNEVIEVLQTILKETIANKVKKAQAYTVMMDGSSDKRWREIEGIVVRFVNEVGKIEEHAIGVEEAHDRSASGLIDILTKCLEELGLTTDGIVSQCYDGASVMSGHRGGLQALLSQTCGRNILYIHCFCHRLHLVVTDIIETTDIICEHYSLVKSLYECLKLADIKKNYNGIKLKRLLDTRWSGHRDCVHAINREVSEIIQCLKLSIEKRDVKSEHKVIAKGLLSQISRPSFILLNKFLNEFLDIINIASHVCQSKTSNLADALNVIDECRTQISDLKEMYTAQKIDHDLDVLDKQYGLETRPVRGKKQSTRLEGFVVDAHIPSALDDEGVTEEFRCVVVELTDCFQMEMESRFTTANTSLWSAMGTLSPSHPDFCNPAFLRPFFEYMLTVPAFKKELSDLHVDDFTALESECKVFKNVIQRKFDSNADIGDIYVFLRENYSEAAPILTDLFKMCVTCGYASARVECLFSALAYVDAPRRRKSGTDRESALTHLLFERELAKTISFEEFSREWLKKPRSLFF